MDNEWVTCRNLDTNAAGKVENIIYANALGNNHAIYWQVFSCYVGHNILIARLGIIKQQLKALGANIPITPCLAH